MMQLEQRGRITVMWEGAGWYMARATFYGTCWHRVAAQQPGAVWAGSRAELFGSNANVPG